MIGQLALAKNIIDETIEEIRTKNIEQFDIFGNNQTHRLADRQLAWKQCIPGDMR